MWATSPRFFRARANRVAVVRDLGVVVDQLLVECDILAKLGFRFHRFACLLQKVAEVAVSPSRPKSRNSLTVGFSSTIFRWIATASRSSASPSDGLPICESSKPTLVWLSPRGYEIA